MIPLRLFRNRTIILAVVASIAVGVGMFGATVFLGQYFQITRGQSPTMSGLMTLPMILGLLVSSTLVGRIITRTGRWKRFLVAGSALLTAGFALMGTIRYDTSSLLLGRLHGADRRRPRHDHAEPGARRAEHRRHRTNSARPARWWRSSAASAARSASPRSARCSATGSRTTSPTAWPDSASRRRLGQRRQPARRAHPARPDPGRGGERVRPRRRRHLPVRRALRADRPDRGDLHQGGAAAAAQQRTDDRRRRARSRPCEAAA